MVSLNYNTDTYPFRTLLENKLNYFELDKIHLDEMFSYKNKFERSNDQSTHYHRKFYELAREEKFKQIYTAFIIETIKPYFENKPIVYQTIPTFRLHFPGNIAVGEYHRDRDYRDNEWASQVKEVNFFLPFTKASGTNTIWVESEEGKEDFYPIISDYGKVIAWDGCNLLHGNKTNEESSTRVSMDFRVMLYENYLPSTIGSINMASKFEIGGYYSLME